MARRPPPATPPALPPEKRLRVIEDRLAALDGLKERHHEEANHDEEQWYQTTSRFLDLVFGSPNPHSQNLMRARSAGEHYVRPLGFMGEDPQDQINYGERMKAYESALRAGLAEIQLLLPEPEHKAVYEPGDEFASYKDLKTILVAAQKEVFLIDNYLNTDIFELYAAAIRSAVAVRMLTNQLKGNLVTVAQKYASRGSFELRTSQDVHDRVVFVDDRCWVIGQSIKDAARKKPTYMIEYENPSRMKPIYEDIWDRAQVTVRS